MIFPPTLQQLKVLVAPDSFKGSLSASEAALYISRGVSLTLPSAHVSLKPMADGGEGTADAIAATLGGSHASIQVMDANGGIVNMPYVVCENQTYGRFAAFEVASVVGLHDATVNPEVRTTRGIGQALRALHKLGHRTVVIGLGGSSTMDAGAGLLAEVACDFKDADGHVHSPTFATLHRVRTVSWRAQDNWLREMKIVGLSDVTAPLCGPYGASHIFGGQKGFESLDHADSVLSRFGEVCEKSLNVQALGRPGAGAAGGLGFALILLGAVVLPGATFILEASGLTNSLADYDWIITGEGKSDLQTLMGKGPFLLAQLARAKGIPITLLSGSIEERADLAVAFDGCFSLMNKPGTLQHAMKNAGPMLSAASSSLTRLFLAARKRSVNSTNSFGNESGST